LVAFDASLTKCLVFTQLLSLILGYLLGAVPKRLTASAVTWSGFAEILQALRDIPEILISGVVTAFSGTAQDAG
jgi:hypothetical protein